MIALDRQILQGLRVPGNSADPVGPDWLQHAAVDITSLGGYTVLTLLVVAAAGFMLLRGHGASAGLLVASAVGAVLLSTGLKALVERARPDVVDHLVRVSSPSFPSGHALLSAVVYLTLAALLTRVYPQAPLRRYIMAVAVVLTLLVGASRVYLGVHWPTDVLAGWGIGAAWAWGGLRLLARLQR